MPPRHILRMRLGQELATFPCHPGHSEPRTVGVATASGAAAERLSRRDTIFQIPSFGACFAPCVDPFGRQLYAITLGVRLPPPSFPPSHPRHLRPLRRRGRLRGRLPPLGQGGAPPGRPRGANFGGPAPGGRQTRPRGAERWPASKGGSRCWTLAAGTAGRSGSWGPPRSGFVTWCWGDLGERW